MTEFPIGTVTFLFTDIEGSTRLLEQHGERYAELLDEHRRVVREACLRHGGVEVDTQGDAFFVAFSSASAAVAAAEEAQRGLAIPVRMGVHTGEPTLNGGDYIGMDVHRAARICSAAHGGQVLLSQTTQDLVAADVRDLGEHRLKDLGRPLRLFQLGEREFPPLRSLNQTNLPAQPGDLVGRERELEELLELLDQRRMVTLTGPGGSGKTRLSLQVAAEAVDRFVGGVFFVPLAAVSDPELVLPTVAQTIGARDGIAEHVGERSLLLLLDNLEQVIEVAPALSELLERCPNLHLLATSRALLRVQGERDYPVEPLAERDAIELFRDRATAAEPLEAVREICRRLDNLPLAVELAAARTRLLAPDKLLQRLDRVLPVLTGGRRDAPERQRTLRSTIEWSYDLLDDREREVFRRLGVFAGSFGVEAAEEVCDSDLETLESLLEKSLLRRWESGRLGMLETIGEYATYMLAHSGEEEQLRRRHAAFFLEVAQSAHLSADEDDLPQQYDAVLADQQNLRRALDWALAAGESELGLKLVVALEQFWVAQSPHEGQRRTQELLEGAEDIPPALRARALRVLGGMTYTTGDFDRGAALAERSLALFEKIGDEGAVTHMQTRLAFDAIRRGDLDRAEELAHSALEISRRLGRRADEAAALAGLAGAEWRRGRHDQALELARRSAAGAAEIGFDWWQVTWLSTAGEWALEIGAAGAQDDLSTALALAQQIGDREHIVFLLALLARLAASRGEAECAGALWGALETEEERAPIGTWEDQRADYWQKVEPHEGEEFERGRARGRQLELEDAVDYALANV